MRRRRAHPFSLFDAERTYRLLDLGATGGFNNPGGIIGAEADFRLFTGYLSAGLSGGTGAWGVRVSPHVRAYPFGLDVAGLFAEAAFSMNFGGTTETKVNGVVLERAERLVTPVLHVGAGWRQTLNSFTWLLFRVREQGAQDHRRGRLREDHTAGVPRSGRPAQCA